MKLRALSEILDQAKSEGSNMLVAKNFANSFEKVLKEALINCNINPKAFEACAPFNDYVTGRVKNIKKTKHRNIASSKRKIAHKSFEKSV